jgi:DNA-binding GntR family transcriptional regulator
MSRVEPVTRRKVSEDVYRALKRDILTLRHPPGASLRERELADRYGVSRVPVREACLRLMQEGLMGSVPYKGYFASRISLKNITDSFELRLLLETEAIARTFDRAGERELKRLSSLAVSEYAHDDWDSHVEFLEKNRQFHLALAGLSGNAELERVLGDLLESMQRYFFLGLGLGEFGPEMREEHENLTALIRSGSRDEARDCLREQIERSRRRIIAKLVTDGADVALE